VCPHCKKESLYTSTAIELGHTFYLGTKYSSVFNAKYMPADDPSILMPIHMGCYGLGISRMIAAIAEVSHDESGIIWPESVAPWNCIVIEGKQGGGESIYDGIASVIGVDNVLLDDRPHMSVGWKLHDAKKIGFPHIIVVGRGWEETGLIEAIHRRSGTTEHVESSALLDPTFWTKSSSS
jgi:prolyl-tRNA synthetase